MRGGASPDALPLPVGSVTDWQAYERRYGYDGAGNLASEQSALTPNQWVRTLAYVPGTNRLVATVGHAAAREIMFSARRYSADEAAAMGLVNRVLPDAELDEYVRKLAQELAANAPPDVQ